MSKKKRNIIYEHLPPQNKAEPKPWDLVNVDLVIPYRKSTRQQHPGVDIIKTNFILTFMNMMDPDIGWFEVIEIPR